MPLCVYVTSSASLYLFSKLSHRLSTLHPFLNPLFQLFASPWVEFFFIFHGDHALSCRRGFGGCLLCRSFSLLLVLKSSFFLFWENSCMGDVQVSSGGSSGAVMEEERLFSTPLAHSLPDSLTISEHSWAVAEETIQDVMDCIHPTLDSEEKRRDVIEYVESLIRGSLGCEVFPYGSVPLKTYLPDGDIDLTTLSSQNIEESLARDVIAVLQEEERNENAEYEVKDTQFIDAEVKLVKCLVQNIVIDISFNQLGGLSTLCFLEQVDRLAGKNHLFKRSVILIKAWCYYESRILGAHHGLISTYALETLVLYIFQVFHSSLNGPLQVLYRFLDYFSKFDWENYCISLNGPVCKSSLPNIVVEKPENGGAALMLTEEFLRNSIDMFSLLSGGFGTNSRAFPLKHLNIIDPLKDNNNLGRSVHRGSFYRICSAFKYGARKLGRILLLPRERATEEIKKFFSNTLERHENKFEIDIRNSPLFCFEGSDIFSSSSQGEPFSDDELQLKLSSSFLDNDNLGVEQGNFVSQYDLDRFSMKLVSSQRESETCYVTDGTSVSGGYLSGDANELAYSKSLSSRNGNYTSDYSLLSSNYGGSLCGQSSRAPSQYSRSSLESENRNYKNSSNSIEEKLGFNSWMEDTLQCSVNVNSVRSRNSNVEGSSSVGSAISGSDANFSEVLSLDFRENELIVIAGDGDADSLNPLSDLCGDYDSHIRSLLHAQGCSCFASAAPIPLLRTSSSSLFQSNKPVDTVSLRPKQASFSQKSTSSVAVTSPILYSNSMPSNSNSAFGLEKRNAQGTGTYLPNMTSCSNWENPVRGKANKVEETYSLSRGNGKAFASSRTNSLEECSYEVPRAHSLAKEQGKSGSCHQSYSRSSLGSLANGLPDSLCRLEFGSLGCLPAVSSLLSDSFPQITKCTLSPEVNGSKSITSKGGRISDQLLHLKNDDEFPPLSL